MQRVVVYAFIFKRFHYYTRRWHHLVAPVNINRPTNVRLEKRAHCIHVQVCSFLFLAYEL